LSDHEHRWVYRSSNLDKQYYLYDCVCGGQLSQPWHLGRLALAPETIADEGGELVREAQSYQYLTDKFEVLHHTSVPMNDVEALEYFGFVNTMYLNAVATYITVKRFGEGEKYQMLPYIYDHDREEAVPLENS
jgi:hypothetical protein